MQTQIQVPARPIKIGDKVRSYDFPDGRRTSYVEGVVEHITEVDVDTLVRVGALDAEVVCFHDCRRYVIRVERAVWSGKDAEVRAPVVFPPVNGTPKLFGDVCNGVELVG